MAYPGDGNHTGSIWASRGDGIAVARNRGTAGFTADNKSAGYRRRDFKDLIKIGTSEPD
jgi:hypothetical protein